MNTDIKALLEAELAQRIHDLSTDQILTLLGQSEAPPGIDTPRPPSLSSRPSSRSGTYARPTLADAVYMAVSTSPQPLTVADAVAAVLQILPDAHKPSIHAAISNAIKSGKLRRNTASLLATG